MGVGNEDRDQFWFVVNTVWEVKGVIEDNIKKAMLLSALQDCMLTWNIKHSSDNLEAGIMVTQASLIKQFSRPKSEA